MNKYVIPTAVIALLSAGVGYAATASDDSSQDVLEALRERLPRTEITDVNCNGVADLCEVIAGDNLFYVDRTARFLVVGRIYDMETQQDLTAATLLEVNPALLAGVSTESDEQQAATGPSGRPVSKEVSAVSLGQLSENGAIKYGRGPKTVTVFSDFRCGYCRRLHETLSDMNVQVIERPISILGSRSLSESVMCSSDPVAAMKAAYKGENPAGGRGCDTSGLDENEAFAREHGFTGTPVIVRSDGDVIEGWRPKEELQTWINGGSNAN